MVSTAAATAMQSVFWSDTAVRGARVCSFWCGTVRRGVVTQELLAARSHRPHTAARAAQLAVSVAAPTPLPQRTRSVLRLPRVRMSVSLSLSLSLSVRHCVDQLNARAQTPAAARA